MKSHIQAIGLFAIICLSMATAALPDEWSVTYPPRFAEATWLPSHQRLCFAVDDSNLDRVIDDGTNVICGGTNAAGIGFAGGPFILGKDGKIVDIRSGVPIPKQTLGELRARVDRAHAKGAKVLGEVIRFYMTPWIQAEHPEWQEINSPGGKPISVDAAQRHARAWLLEFALWRLVHQVAGRAGQAARLGRLQHGRIRLLVAVFLPGVRGLLQERHGQGDPRDGRREQPGIPPLPQVAARSLHPFRLQMDGRAQGGQTGFRGGTLDDRPGALVALDGRSGGRGNRRRCTACWMPRSSSCSGIFRPTREATCCRRSRADITAA